VPRPPQNVTPPPHTHPALHTPHFTPRTHRWWPPVSRLPLLPPLPVAAATQEPAGGKTALLIACSWPLPDPELIAALLKAGAPADAQDKPGARRCLQPAGLGPGLLVHALKQKKCWNATAACCSCCTPACAGGRVLLPLMAHEVGRQQQPAACCAGGCTALMLALQAGHAELAQLLVQHTQQVRGRAGSS
jgi:hypothetical protein